MKKQLMILGLATLAASTLVSTLASAQGLAEVARQEELRKRAIRAASSQKPVKVYTNENLTPDFTMPAQSPAQAAATTPLARTGQKPAAGPDPANNGEDTGGNPDV